MSTAKQAEVGVLFGYGSIGGRHGKALAKRVDRLFIMDSNPDARARAAENHPSATILDSLEAFNRASVPVERSLSVIATWGPSHAEMFDALADRGAKHILCEKPMADSVARADAMTKRARREGIVLAVHHYLRYSGLAAALARLAAEHQLGEPKQLTLMGGACCLVTNGLHWVDLATLLFGAQPTSVISTALEQRINPRSPDVGFFGGTAVWTFPGERETVMATNNGSSIALRAFVYYRDAIAEIDDDLRVNLARRDREALARFPKVTRTGAGVEPLHSDVPPEILGAEARIDAAQSEVARGDVRIGPAEVGVASVSVCVGALTSSKLRRAVDLPIAPDSEWGRQQWPIS